MSNITSHFSAVLPISLEDNKLYVTLVIYNNHHRDRQEVRLIGGCGLFDESPIDTVRREMGQEAGLIPNIDDLEDFFFLVTFKDMNDLDHEGGIHRKHVYTCFNPLESLEARVSEADIEGTINIPLWQLIAHLSRLYPLPSGHKVLNRFHKEGMIEVILMLTKHISKVDEYVDKYNLKK